MFSLLCVVSPGIGNDNTPMKFIQDYCSFNYEQFIAKAKLKGGEEEGRDFTLNVHGTTIYDIVVLCELITLALIHLQTKTYDISPQWGELPNKIKVMGHLSENFDQNLANLWVRFLMECTLASWYPCVITYIRLIFQNIR